MKILITKNEKFIKDFQTEFLKETVNHPILNKFEIPFNEFEILTLKNPLTLIENVIILDTAEKRRHDQFLDLVKFHHQEEIPPSEINIEFQNQNTEKNYDFYESQILESIGGEYLLNYELRKFQYSSFSTDLENLVKFQSENLWNKLEMLQDMEIIQFDKVEKRNDRMQLDKFRLDLDIGKTLRDINDSDMIAVIINLDFKDQMLIKLNDLKLPKRWFPKNMNFFLPHSISKLTKILDLDVNWNYVNALKDIYGDSYCKFQDLVLETQWNDNQNVSLDSFKPESYISEQNSPIKELENQGSLIEPTSVLETKFLVDQFMMKRGRATSSVDLESESKKPKMQREKSIIQGFAMNNVQEAHKDIMHLECPNFDTQNAQLHKYIANSDFFSRRELISLLESKYAIELLERNMYDQSSKYQGEDLIIDEKTCIILNSLLDLLFPIQEDFINTISETQIGQRILKLSLRYSNIHIILSEYDLEKPDSRILLSKIKIDPFTLPIRKSFFALYKFSTYLSSLLDVKIKIIFSSKYEHIAWLIRSIGDNQATDYQSARGSSIAHNLHSWSSRTWLTEIESSAERFLSHFPVINSFQAQIVLAQASLKEILNMPKSELVERFKVWIPEKNLQIMYSMTNMKLEL